MRGAHRFENGQVLVTDGGNARIVLFSKTGKPLWASGRRGDGPGEYRALAAATRCTNGPFAAFDANNGRVTLISDSGTVLGTRILTGGQLGRLIWCTGMANEVVIWRQDLFLPMTTGYYRLPVLLLRFRADGRLDTMAMRYNEWYGFSGSDGANFQPPLREPVFVGGGREDRLALRGERQPLRCAGPRDSDRRLHRPRAAQTTALRRRLGPGAAGFHQRAISRSEATTPSP